MSLYEREKDLRCPICEEGGVSGRISGDRVDREGETAELDLHFSEQRNVRQLRINKLCMVEFKKRVDGLLTGSEVKSAKERPGLEQSDAARISGGGQVVFSKYASDEVTQTDNWTYMNLTISHPCT